MPTQTNPNSTKPAAGPWEVMPWAAGFRDPELPPHSIVWTAHEVYETVAYVHLNPHADANAQLIANAPRLLKAANDLWHANAAEGQDRDEMLIASAWVELIDAIEAAEGRESTPVDVVGCAGDLGCFLPDGHLGEHVPAEPQP